MSRTLRNALIASLESDDPEIMNPLTDQQETNIDEVLLDINEASDEVAESDEVVEVLEDAEQSMEALASSLESAISEEGGLSPQAARTHNIAMQNALRALPISLDDVTVSSESFGGHGDKLTASQEALEGVKATLSKLWEGIKNAVRKAWAAVVTFMTTIGKSSRAVKASGQALIKQAAATKGKATGKVDATALARALHVGGTFNKMPSAALNEIVKGGVGIATSAKNAEAGLKDIGGKIASGHYDDVADRQAFADKVVDVLPQGELPGGKRIEISDSGAPSLQSASKLSAESVELDVPEINEIKQIGQSIVKLGDFMESYSSKSFKELQKSVETFIAQQDALVKKAGFSSKEETEKTRKGLRDFSKFAVIARGCGPQYLSYAASSAKVAYAFGKKALAQYK